jgi:SHS2 domain-containing protein
VGFRQLEHTADLALEIWAESEARLFEEAGRAVVEILTEGEEVRPSGERAIVISAEDEEERFVRWLNEILVLAVTEGFLFSGVRSLELRDVGLSATIAGQEGASDRVRTELKSTTYHDLFVGEEGGTWRARVVIDV